MTSEIEDRPPKKQKLDPLGAHIASFDPACEPLLKLNDAELKQQLGEQTEGLGRHRSRLGRLKAADPAAAGGPDTAPGLSALLELTCVWVEQSNGRRRGVGVHGDAAQAVAALTGTTGRRRALAAEEALALLAWAGASGGVSSVAGTGVDSSAAMVSPSG